MPEAAAAAAEAPDSSEDESDDDTFPAGPQEEYEGAPQLSSGAVFEAVMEEAFERASERAATGRSGEPRKAEEQGGRCARHCTPNIRALAVSCTLFSLITVAQVFAAKVAHSSALLVDCISMAVDAFTYLGNIFVECRKRKPGRHTISQLIIVACSLGLLSFFTIQAMRESAGTIEVCQGKAVAEEEADDVNGWITMAFASGGLAFDIACMAEFHRSNRKQQSVKQVNMFSAFLHVGADLLRSSSTLIMSLLILLTTHDSTCLDAYTSLIIGVSILCGAAVGFWKWLKMLITHLCYPE